MGSCLEVAHGLQEEGWTKIWFKAEISIPKSGIELRQKLSAQAEYTYRHNGHDIIIIVSIEFEKDSCTLKIQRLLTNACQTFSAEEILRQEKDREEIIGLKAKVINVASLFFNGLVDAVERTMQKTSKLALQSSISFQLIFDVLTGKFTWEINCAPELPTTRQTRYSITEFYLSSGFRSEESRKEPVDQSLESLADLMTDGIMSVCAALNWRLKQTVGSAIKRIPP